MINEKETKVLVGKKIRERRENQGFTQADLSEQLGCSNRHISEVERGKVSLSFSKLVEVCNILKTTPAALYGGEDIDEIVYKIGMLPEKEKNAVVQLVNSLIEEV